MLKLVAWLDDPATQAEVAAAPGDVFSSVLGRALTPLREADDRSMAWPRGQVVAWSRSVSDASGHELADLLRSATGARRVDMVDEVLQKGSAELPFATGPVRVGIVFRRPDLAPDDFDAIYRDHAKVVERHGPLFDRYTANFPVRGASPVPWDAFAEQWFDSAETWAEHDRQIAEDKPEVVADIARFAATIQQFAAHDTALLTYEGE